MPWVRKIISGRERMVYVPSTPAKPPSLPSWWFKPATTAPLVQKTVTAIAAAKEPAVPAPIVSGRASAGTLPTVPRAEPTRRAIGAEPAPRISGRAGVGPLPAPAIPRAEPTRRAVGAGTPVQQATAGFQRLFGAIGGGITGGAVAAYTGIAQGRPVSLGEFTSAVTRGVAQGRSGAGLATQGRATPTPINTPESLGLYQGRPRLGGAEGRAIQGPSALDVFLGRQARATTTEELTGAVPRLQERLRVIGATPRQQAQGGAMAFLDGLGRGVLPDVMTDAVASYVIGPLGYGSIEELMRDLGFIPNPDAPGTWLRGEAVTIPSGGGFGGGGGGGGSFFIPSSIDGSRGGRSAMGLVNWRI